MSLEHGDYSVLVKDNVIIIILKGSFNEYGARSLCHEVQKIVDSFAGKKFSVIANLLQLEGATPEAFDEIEQQNQWIYDKGIVVKAIVIDSIMLKRLNRKKVPSQRLIKTRFFSHEEDAWNWVRQESQTKQG